MMVRHGNINGCDIKPALRSRVFRPRFLDPVDHAAALMKVTNRLGER